MRITFVLRTAALFTALAVLTPTFAFAQEEQPPANLGPRKKAPVAATTGKQPPAAEVVAKHGAWTVQCGVVPEGQPETGKQCGMSQITKSAKNDKIGLSMVLAKSKQGDKVVTMMRIMAPIGVYLPTGIALEIDGAAVGRVPFTRCRPTICEALAEASGPTLTKLKSGTAANFIIYEAPGLGIPMKISLEGFSKALAELDKQ